MLPGNRTVLNLNVIVRSPSNKGNLTLKFSGSPLHGSANNIELGH